MRSPRLVTVSLVLLGLSFASIPAQASLPGIEDYTNERIVPLLISPTSAKADGSGFLYSSRIVFTSAHTAVTFNSKGELVDFREQLSVGKPNSNVKTSGPGVRVIKRFASPGYTANKEGDTNDFAILVLERDLMKVEPAQLMTPEIEKDLVEKRATVKMHGYGLHVDLCGANENPPCRGKPFDSSLVPRSTEATLRPAGDFAQLIPNPIQPRFANELLFFSPEKTGMCAGDSGGSLTTTYNGKLIYLSNIGTGANTYGCGLGGGYDGKGGFQHSPQIYKQSELIKEAEKFVAEQIAVENAEGKTKVETAKKKLTITCVKGKTIKKVTAVNPKCPVGYKKK